MNEIKMDLSAMENFAEEQKSVVVNKQEIISHVPEEEQGFDVINFTIYSSIIIVVVLLILGLSGPLMTFVKTLSLTSELNTFQTKIHDVYGGQPNGYTGINDEEVIKSHAYSTSLNSTGTALSSSSTGAITISSDDGGGLTFSVEYAAVPSGVCQSIISKLSSSGNWNEIDVNGSMIWSGTSAVPTKSTIDTQCSATANVPMKFISN